jgi:hypothetical protein
MYLFIRLIPYTAYCFYSINSVIYKLVQTGYLIPSAATYESLIPFSIISGKVIFCRGFIGIGGIHHIKGLLIFNYIKKG